MHSTDLHTLDRKILSPWNLAIWLDSTHLDAQSALNDSHVAALEGLKEDLFTLVGLHTVHILSTLN